VVLVQSGLGFFPVPRPDLQALFSTLVYICWKSGCYYDVRITTHWRVGRDSCVIITGRFSTHVNKYCEFRSFLICCPSTKFNTYCVFVHGGLLVTRVLRNRKKIYRVDFFGKARFSGLTNYLIRHNSQNGNMMSLPRALCSCWPRCLTSLTNPLCWSLFECHAHFKICESHLWPNLWVLNIPIVFRTLVADTRLPCSSQHRGSPPSHTSNY
jgi:hypothetical protein